MPSIEFNEGTQEAFEVFADEAAEIIPDASLTFVSDPKFGHPYIIVHVKDDYGVGTLMVDVGDTLSLIDGKIRVRRTTIDEW